MKYEWIDSMKELPKIGEPVLICILDAETEQKMFTAKLLYVGNDDARYWDVNCKNISTVMMGRFLFWMPLPPMPNETEVKE